MVHAGHAHGVIGVAVGQRDQRARGDGQRRGGSLTPCAACRSGWSAWTAAEAGSGSAAAAGVMAGRTHRKTVAAVMLATTLAVAMATRRLRTWLRLKKACAKVGAT